MDFCLICIFFLFPPETSTNGDLTSGNLLWHIAVFTFSQSPNVLTKGLLPQLHPMICHPLQADAEKSFFPSSSWQPFIYWRTVITAVQETQLPQESLEVSQSAAVSSSPRLHFSGQNNPILSFFPYRSYFLNFC